MVKCISLTLVLLLLTQVSSSALQNPSIADMEREYREKSSLLDRQDKSIAWEENRILLQLVDSCDQQALLSRLLECPANVPTATFETILAGIFVEKLLEDCDLSTLTNLITCRCPGAFLYIPLEWHLESSECPEAIRCLFEAFRNARSDEAKISILHCLQRAFPLLRQPGQSDNAYVDACEKWYNKNRNVCSVNDDYPYFISRPAADSSIEKGLFVRPLPLYLEQEFTTKVLLLEPDAKNRARTEHNVLFRLLEDLPPENQNEVIDNLTVASQAISSSTYDKVLTEAAIDLCLEEEDFDSLQNLLSRRCPEYIAGKPLEWRLAQADQSSVAFRLANAYKAAESPQSASAIVNCLARAFPSLRSEKHSNDEFVKSCVDWQKKNANKYSINYEYPFLPGPVQAATTNRDLFLIKAPSSLEEEFDKVPCDANWVRPTFDSVKAMFVKLDRAARDKEYTRLCERTGSMTESRFNMLLTQVYFEYLLQNNQTDQLIRLMACRSPWYYKGQPLEWALAEAKGTDAILYLAKAYQIAESEYQAEDLELCLGRALRSLWERDIPSEEYFVSSCQRWYLENRNKSVLNRDYPFLKSDSEHKRIPGKIDLFLPKQ